ncbi:MAG: hypothetical protein ACFB10_01315, partial [Salibacteraceae bacterium]
LDERLPRCTGPLVAATTIKVFGPTSDRQILFVSQPPLWGGKKNEDKFCLPKTDRGYKPLFASQDCFHLLKFDPKPYC